MKQLTKSHINTINFIIIKLISDYVTVYADPNSDNNFIIEDVNNIIKCLQNFNKTKNVDNLLNKIVETDTVVREHFANIFYYCSDNKLTSEIYC